MENRNILNRIQILWPHAAIIALAVLARLIPHVPNVAPITGLALFSGARYSKKSAIAFPLLAMFVSDLFLGFHATIWYVYGSFILISLIGIVMGNRKSVKAILAASLTSSVLFFLITNFGVWKEMDMYAKTPAGLLNAYAMGLPFFRNTILGDLLFTFGFFYGYRFILRYRAKTSSVMTWNREYRIGNKES